jgi:hypothetical protein
MATRTALLCGMEFRSWFGGTEELRDLAQKLGEKSHAHLELDVHDLLAGFVERSRTATGGFTTVFAGGHTRSRTDGATRIVRASFATGAFAAS